jgi:hypothetical protein
MGVIFPYFWFFDVFFTQRSIKMSFQIICCQKTQKISTSEWDFTSILVNRFWYKGKVLFQNPNLIIPVCQIPYLYTKNGWPMLVESHSEAEVDIFFYFLIAGNLKNIFDQPVSWLKKLSQQPNLFCVEFINLSWKQRLLDWFLVNIFIQFFAFYYILLYYST